MNRFKFFGTLFFLSVFFLGSVSAANCNWLGGNSITQTDWDNIANWSCNAIPTGNDDVLFTISSDITISGNISTPSRVKAKGTLTILSGINFDVNKLAALGTVINHGDLTFNGNTNTSSGYRLTVHDSGSFTNTGYVDIQDDNKGGIRVISGGVLNNSGIIDIDVPVGSFALKVESGGTINDTGAINNINDSKVVCNGTCFSAIFPVELISFTVNQNDSEEIVLDWSTASESNNLGFEIYKSRNGFDWEFLGFLEGAENSAEGQEYRFVDDEPAYGANFYKILQLDFSGEVENLSVRSLDFKEGGLGITFYPNPTRNKIFLSAAQELDFINTRLVSASGMLVFESDDNPFPMDISGLPGGIYFLRIKTFGREVSEMIIIGND